MAAAADPTNDPCWASEGESVIRKVARAHGNGPIDGTDNGNIATRVLTFTKTRADTGVRVGPMPVHRAASAREIEAQDALAALKATNPTP